MNGIYGSNKILTHISIIIWIMYTALTAPMCFNSNTSYILTILYLLLLGIFNQLFNKKIILISFYWIIINILCYIFKSNQFNLNNVIGYLIPILISFSLIVTIGPNLWEKLEKYIYYLTIVSLVLFAGQVITGNLYDQLSGLFGNYIADVYREQRPTSWYIFVYTYSPIENTSFPRNSGFMWEPGAFAMILSVFLSYRFLKYGVSLNKHNIVYIIAIISTFSTAGYIILTLFFLIYIIESRNIMLAIPLVLLFSLLLPSIISLEFMGEKIQNYSDNLGQSFDNDRWGVYEYNRFETFLINIRKLIEFPIGYGASQITDKYNNYFVGVNGIGVFARSWGIIGIYYAFKSIILMLKSWCSEQFKHPKLCITLFFVILLISFFSNPIERNILFITLILYPQIYHKQLQNSTSQLITK